MSDSRHDGKRHDGYEHGACDDVCADMFQLCCVVDKSIVPAKVRIPVYIVVIATFVTILQLVLKAYMLKARCGSRYIHTSDCGQLHSPWPC